MFDVILSVTILGHTYKKVSCIADNKKAPDCSGATRP